MFRSSTASLRFLKSQPYSWPPGNDDSVGHRFWRVFVTCIHWALNVSCEPFGHERVIKHNGWYKFHIYLMNALFDKDPCHFSARNRCGAQQRFMHVRLGLQYRLSFAFFSQVGLFSKWFASWSGPGRLWGHSLPGVAGNRCRQLQRHPWWGSRQRGL